MARRVRRGYGWLAAVLLLSCAAEGPTPPPSPLSTPLPGQPDPNSPYRFPSERPVVLVEPQLVCPNQTVRLKASRLPVNADIEVWLSGVRAGGWKVGNPPNPSTIAAIPMGVAHTDANGEFRFSFAVAAGLEQPLTGGSKLFSIWLMYPKEGAQTPIQPDAATFAFCQ